MYGVPTVNILWTKYNYMYMYFLIMDQSVIYATCKRSIVSTLCLMGAHGESLINCVLFFFKDLSEAVWFPVVGNESNTQNTNHSVLIQMHSVIKCSPELLVSHPVVVVHHYVNWGMTVLLLDLSFPMVLYRYQDFPVLLKSVKDHCQAHTSKIPGS